MTDSLPIAEYILRMDDEHFRDAGRKLQPVRRFGSLRSAASVALLGFLLACVFIRAIGDRNWQLLLAPILVMSFFAVVYFKLRNQGNALYRKSPDFGSDVRLKLTNDGLEMFGAVANSSYQWPAFARAVLDTDGILLVLHQGGGLWLPDRALVTGARDVADRRILDHVPEVEQRR